MKMVTYRDRDGKPLVVEYDETAPCIVCGLPVGAASMGGTAVCPSCDCGRFRDGEQMLPPFKGAPEEEWVEFRRRCAEHADPEHIAWLHKRRLGEFNRQPQ